jgi:hypothetical protein
VLNPETGAIESQFNPFAGFDGGVRVASGDLNGDGIPDVVVSAIAPMGPIKAFDGATGALLMSFYPFPGFMGTVNIAVGDVTGSGYADIIAVASGPGSNGHVKVFSGQNGSLIGSFFAYSGFNGDVSVAAGDFGASGVDEIVTVASLNGHVKVYDLDGSLYQSPTLPGFVFSFYTFQGFDGDVSVAAGDLSGSGYADLVVASGPGSRGQIKVFDGPSGSLVGNFYAFGPYTYEGAYVGLASVTGKRALDIAVTPGPGPQADVETYDLFGNSLGVSYPAFTSYAGGAYISGSNT